MRGTQFQRILNITVICIAVGSLVFGAFSMLPARNPMGPLMGKILSSKHNLSGLLGNLDPVALAEAMKANPETTARTLAALGEEGAAVIAECINENPEFFAALLREMDPVAMARVVNDPEMMDFNLALSSRLDPKAIAGILNGNGDFLSRLVGRLDPEVIAAAVNANGEFLAASVAAMDTAVLARAVNENGDFLARFISFLDPVVLAGVANANPTLVSDLMGFLDTGVVANAVNSNQAFLQELLGKLDPRVITTGMNAHPTFISRMMAYLDPKVIAAAMNANSASMARMVERLSDELLTAVLATTANNREWVSSLLSRLEPSVVAAAMTASSSFSAKLVREIDPSWAAGIANAHPKLVFAVMDHIEKHPELVARMANNGDVLARALSLIDTAAVGAALADHRGLVTRLVPLLDPAMSAATNKAMEGNAGLISAVLANLDGVRIASALAQAPSFLTGLVSRFSPALGTALSRGSNDNPGLLINIMNNLDASSVAKGLDMAGGFIASLVSALPADMARTVARALDANPALLEFSLAGMDTKVLAGILNGGAADALIAGLVPLLSRDLAQAIAEGINTDAAQPAAQSMIKAVMASSDPAIMAQAINRNPDFVAGVLSRLSEDTAKAVAEGMNANPDAAREMGRYLDSATGRRIAEALSSNAGIIKPLVANLSPQVGAAIAEGMNRNLSDMNRVMMENLSSAVGKEIAAGLNANPGLVQALLPALDGNTGKEIALGLNINATTHSPSFLEAMVGATLPDTARAMARAMNQPPYNMDAFASQLIVNLNADTAKAVAQGLNGNTALLTEMLCNTDGAMVAEQLSQNQDWTLALIKNLDASAIAAAINSALGAAGGKALVADFLGNLDADIVARAMNENPDSSLGFLYRAAEIGLGSKLGEVLVRAGVGSREGFLTRLLAKINGPTLRAVINRVGDNHNADLPIPGHNIFECLWLYQPYNEARNEGPSWTRFLGDAEDATPYLSTGRTNLPPLPPGFTP